MSCLISTAAHPHTTKEYKQKYKIIQSSTINGISNLINTITFCSVIVLFSSFADLAGINIYNNILSRRPGNKCHFFHVIIVVIPARACRLNCWLPALICQRKLVSFPAFHNFICNSAFHTHTHTVLRSMSVCL